MEGMIWGVAAMVVKDAIKQPYLKGRDYERNVRQAYRDVDNLKITLAHVRTNCTTEDLTTGPHAAFIRRAEVQLKDAYRTLNKEYHRKAGFSTLMEYASTPGAEMSLLDIGKEANQTARGLGDLLSEIRFARMGKSKEDGKSKEEKKSRSPSPRATAPSPRSIPSPQHIPILHPSHPAAYDMGLYGHGGIASDGFGSPHSLSSGDRDSLFDRPGLKPANVYSPPSSTTDSSRESSSSRSRHRHRSQSEKPKKTHHKSSSSRQQHLLQQSSPPSSSSWLKSPKPFDEVLKSNGRTRERELALDNLQYGIDNALRAQYRSTSSPSGGDQQEEEEAMEYLEYTLREVLRLQRLSSSNKTPSKSSSSSNNNNNNNSNSSVDQALCSAVEALDEAMKGLVAARSDKDKKYALKRVSRALEVLDGALAERKRYQQQQQQARRGESSPRTRSQSSRPSSREMVAAMASSGRRRSPQQQYGRSREEEEEGEEGNRRRYSMDR